MASSTRDASTWYVLLALGLGACEVANSDAYTFGAGTTLEESGGLFPGSGRNAAGGAGSVAGSPTAAGTGATMARGGAHALASGGGSSSSTAGQGSSSGGQSNSSSAGAGAGPKCEPGLRRCDPSARVAQVCAASGQWQSQPCDFLCKDGACEGACAPGTRSCRDLVPQRCSDDGVWLDAGPGCSAFCLEGVCTGACSDGATQCASSEAVQECQGGQWGQSTACPFACLEDDCGGVCRPGDTQCVSETEMETCGALGSWGFRATCDYVCAGKSCGGQCKPGTKRCASPTQFETCDQTGGWGALSPCEFACVNDACAGVCEPGSKRCGASGSTVETCSVTGRWEARSCPGACVNGACSTCTPGETECVSSTQVRTCSASGEWGAESECPNACVTNQCGGVCKPMARECVAGASAPQYRVCVQSGQWGGATACAPEPACNAGSCGKAPKLVFVTSTLYTGNLGGLSGADAKCQERASSAGLPGTFRAFLSDSTGSPSTRFTKQVGPYRRIDGEIVAQNFSDLISNGVAHMINLTEKNGPPPEAKPGGTLDNICSEETSNLVWTNTSRSGTAISQDGGCSNWSTTNSGKTAFGRWDDPAFWTAYCTSTGGEMARCASQAPLYCFEQ
jgi:hypothetical protein